MNHDQHASTGRLQQAWELRERKHALARPLDISVVVEEAFKRGPEMVFAEAFSDATGPLTFEQMSANLKLRNAPYRGISARDLRDLADFYHETYGALLKKSETRDRYYLVQPDSTSQRVDARL